MGKVLSVSCGVHIMVQFAVVGSTFHVSTIRHYGVKMSGDIVGKTLSVYHGVCHNGMISPCGVSGNDISRGSGTRAETIFFANPGPKGRILHSGSFARSQREPDDFPIQRSKSGGAMSSGYRARAV